VAAHYLRRLQSVAAKVDTDAARAARHLRLLGS
jgi:hypothetical protein